MAIPARDIRCIEAGQIFRLDDDVLEDLVDRMAEVDLAVRIRRAVMQHEQRPPRGIGTQLRVEALALPALQHRRLALGQVAAHRKFRRRQMKSGFVILGHRNLPLRWIA